MWRPIKSALTSWPRLSSGVSRTFRTGHTRKHAHLGILSKLRALSEKHPFLSNCMTFGVLYGGAELSQQSLYHVFSSNHGHKHPSEADERTHEFSLDWESVKRYFFMGTCVFPLLYHPWYKWLDKTFRGTGPKIVVTKTLLDQFLIGPPGIFLFFVGMNLLEGKSDVFEELKEKFFLTFYSECCFWLPIQTVNFWLISPKLRVTFMGAAFFVWLNILCIIKNLDHYAEE